MLFRILSFAKVRLCVPTTSWNGKEIMKVVTGIDNGYGSQPTWMELKPNLNCIVPKKKICKHTINNDLCCDEIFIKNLICLNLDPCHTLAGFRRASFQVVLFHKVILCENNIMLLFQRKYSFCVGSSNFWEVEDIYIRGLFKNIRTDHSIWSR